MYNKFLEYLLENKPEKVISQKGIKIRKIVNNFMKNEKFYWPEGNFRVK